MKAVVSLNSLERRRVRLLAREVLAAEPGTEADISLMRARCRARFYEWGDLFLRVIELARVHRADQKQLARLAELRADLRAFVADDARPDDDDRAANENGEKHESQ